MTSSNKKAVCCQLPGKKKGWQLKKKSIKIPITLFIVTNLYYFIISSDWALSILSLIYIIVNSNYTQWYKKRQL